MFDRDKVIYSIERCVCNVNDACRDCAYYDADHPNIKCVEMLLRDAMKLLKEQEPRVITREDLKQFEGSPCWFESHGTYMGKDGFWIIPAMFRTFFTGTIMSYTYGVGDCGELGLSAYNKVWRCWSARPTDEQRKEVKWNDGD